MTEPGPGQLLLQAEYSAISVGTEGGLLRDSFLGYPLVPGYSLVGRVIGCGTQVTGFKLGERVCTSGSHASHFIADPAFTVPVPPTVDPEQASLFNLAHVALYGIRRAQLQLGESMLVIGQGLLGLLVARLARLSGAAPLISAELNALRRDHSRRCAVDATLDPADSGSLSWLSSLPGGGPAVIVDTSASAAGLELALDVIREQGRIVLLGTTADSDAVNVQRRLSHKGAQLLGAYINSKPWSLSRRDVGIRGWPPSLEPSASAYAGSDAWTSRRDIETIFELMRLGRLVLADLITHRFRPEQAPAAYAMVHSRDPTLIGGIFHWQ